MFVYVVFLSIKYGATLVAELYAAMCDGFEAAELMRHAVVL